MQAQRPYLVVGGAGFIGSHLVDRLLAEGRAVDVVDDLSTGSLGNLRDARQSGGALKIHNADARSADFEALVGLRRPDVIYHLALLPRPAASPDEVAAVYPALLVTLEAARRHRVPRVVVALPATTIYGHPAAARLPVKEGDIEPRGVRGVTARAMIDLLSLYRERHSIEFAALAVASAYGTRQRPEAGVVATFARSLDERVSPVLHGDGRQTRDFVFVDDVVDALFRAGERGSGLVINVGTGEQTQVRALWALMSEGSGLVAESAPGRRDELSRFAVSPVRARIHLGWSPWTELSEGLARLRNESE